MASTSNHVGGGVSHPVVFSTQTPYLLPSQKFMIPANWKRYQLSQLVNKALSLAKPIPFDFLVRGELLRTTLSEWCTEHGFGEEETLEIEYIQSIMPPQRLSEIPHEDWVSSVTCQLPGHFITASYDGYVRAFNYSQKLIASNLLHTAPITSVCIVPSGETSIIATSSQDLSAQISRLSLPAPNDESLEAIQPLATLHLHTGPVSSVAASPSGTQFVTSSWDSLIGLWDSSIPDSDEVPAESTLGHERKNKKRRVNESDSPKRKAPIAVLKSHTDRVSKAVFTDHNVAVSCGFDSTIRSWNTEIGICTNTITASEKPFLDLVVLKDGNTALAASTDRTVTVYDLRTDGVSLSPLVGNLIHPATPSCIALSPREASQQIAIGSYDGVARIWDLRSVKSAISSFKAWDSKGKEGRKILSIDWAPGVLGVGGECGFEVWQISEANS